MELYIHIPFCVRKCAYCDFLSAPADQDTIGRYMECLEKQLVRQAASFQEKVIDTVFIGATGITLENGLTNTTYLEAEMKRIVIRRSRGAVLMADHSKFDSSSIITFCNFEDLSCIVTDTLPPQRYIDAMRINQIRLLCPETEKD